MFLSPLFIDLKMMSKRSPQDATALVLEAYQETVASFLKKMATDSKCRTCNAVNPKLRKEGYTKIFTQPLSKGQRNSNESNKTVLVSPTTKVVLGVKDGLDFLTSLDVLETLRRLWSNVRKIACYLKTSSNSLCLHILLSPKRSLL